MSTRLLLLVVLLAAWPLQSFDEAVRTRVQASRREWLDEPMHQVTNSGRPLIVLGVAAGLLGGAAGRAALLEGAVALVPVNLAVEGLKYATNRQRPNGDHDRRNSAFPSSHAANAFALAVIVARRWRRAALPAFAYAALVAYSRVYLNKHWCVDVVAGALLGGLLAWWALNWWRAWRAGSSPDSPTSSLTS